MRISDLKFEISDWRAPLGAALITIIAAGCSTLDTPAPHEHSPATIHASTIPDSEASAWKEISEVLDKPGVLHKGVYAITFPRDDLSVSIEGMDVPTAAGIESIFYFYRCSCGKMIVIGQFVVADYEANDVLYALQKEDFLVSSVGPLLLYEKPRLLAVRFQAEGSPERLAHALKSALQWTNRSSR